MKTWAETFFDAAFMSGIWGLLTWAFGPLEADGFGIISAVCFIAAVFAFIGWPESRKASDFAAEHEPDPMSDGPLDGWGR